MSDSNVPYVRQNTATTTATESSNSHLAFIDGLRAFAALFVVLGHWWELSYTSHAGLIGLLTNWLLYPHLAVDAFIVLSGFCLVIPVMRSGELKGGAATFFRRRAWRILPPYYLCLLLSLLLGIFIQHFGQHQHEIVTAKSFAVNLCLLQDWLPEFNKINSPFWSIAVECKIYLLFPIFVTILLRYGRVAVLLSASALTALYMSIYHLIRPNASMGFLCPWYIVLFAAGVVAGSVAFVDAKASTQSKTSVRLMFIFFFMAAVLLYMFAITPTSTDVFDSHLLYIDLFVGAFVACLLVFLQQRPNAIFRRLLNYRRLVTVGLFAYSIYLTHLPMLEIMRIVVNRLTIYHPVQSLRMGLIGTVGLPVILLFAYCFYRIIEEPFIKRRSLTMLKSMLLQRQK